MTIDKPLLVLVIPVASLHAGWWLTVIYKKILNQDTLIFLRCFWGGVGIRGWLSQSILTPKNYQQPKSALLVTYCRWILYCSLLLCFLFVCFQILQFRADARWYCKYSDGFDIQLSSSFQKPHWSRLWISDQPPGWINHTEHLKSYNNQYGHLNIFISRYLAAFVTCLEHCKKQIN